MRIVELLINELDKLSGFDAVALVEEPAIEADFFAFKADDLQELIEFELIKSMMKEEFESITIGGKPLYDTIEEAERVAKELGCEGHHIHSVDGVDWYMPCGDHSDLTDELLENYEFESYNDYPQSATNAAKRALKYKDENPDNDCGTRVGWARANQLAKRESISEETIARMASFARHLQYEDVPYSEGCGGLMVDAWGGRAAIEWAQGKLDDIREDMSMIKKEGETLSFTGKDTKHNFALNVDEQVVVGPLMIPDKLILRLDSENNPYYVYFSQATVKAIANKMMKSKLLDRMNIEHNADEIIDGYMMESWIISDSANDKSNSYGFDLPEGTWMGMYKVENRSVWDLVKQQKLKGFSIEGFFSDKLIQSKKQS